MIMMPYMVMNDNFRSSRNTANHLDATIGPAILLDVERRAQVVSPAQTLSLMKLSPGICFSLPVQAAVTMLAMSQDAILGASSVLDDCATHPDGRPGAL